MMLKRGIPDPKTIDHYLTIQKIIIKKEWHAEVQSLLLKNGLSEEFMYGRELAIEPK